MIRGIAFNLPRTVTATGDAALLGLAGIHGYLLATAVAPPGYFVAYCGAVIVGCLAVAGAIWVDVDALAPWLAWLAGSVLCTAFLAGYLISRLAILPGLPALTGRWDIAPGSLAGLCAAGFLAVHLTVLTGINVAFGQHRDWHD